jgi:hypothetical protein
MKIDLNLNVGLIEAYTEEKASKMPLGTSFAELYDHINKLEVATGYNFPQVVLQLKQDCMMALGLVEPINPEQIDHAPVESQSTQEGK